MNFKQKLNELKAKFKAKITENSTPDEISEVDGIIKGMDELEASHKKLEDENAKFKDVIVRMVTTQGDSKQPTDDSTGSKPKSIEECIAEELNKK